MSSYYNVCCKHQKASGDPKDIVYQKVGYVRVSASGNWFITLYHQPGVEYRVFSSKESNLPVIE